MNGILKGYLSIIVEGKLLKPERRTIMKRLMIEDMYYNGDEKIFDVIKNSTYDEIFSIMQELEKENGRLMLDR